MHWGKLRWLERSLVNSGSRWAGRFLHFSFGMRCLKHQFDGIGNSSRVFFMKLSPLCVSRSSSHSCLYRAQDLAKVVSAASWDLQNILVAEIYLLVSLGVPSTSYYWEIRNSFKMSQGKTLGLIYFELIPCVLLLLRSLQSQFLSNAGLFHRLFCSSSRFSICSICIWIDSIWIVLQAARHTVHWEQRRERPGASFVFRATSKLFNSVGKI